jgi:hypothetical protein
VKPAGCPEMPITYAVNVAPHLRHALSLRTRRMERRRQLHAPHGGARSLLIVTVGCLLFWAAVAYGVRSLF